MTILTVGQRRFLRLHATHMVERWQWHFCGTQLRAHYGTRRATIWVDELNDLISRGLMFRGIGSADVHATSDGKALVQ